MEQTIPLDLLYEGASRMGIELTQEQLLACDQLSALMLNANQHINLTRITEPEDIVRLHFLDSLACLAVHHPDTEAEAVDIGTGAGFPGLPIKIACPDIKLTLVDSTRKKVQFVKDTINTLGLQDIQPLCSRAEEMCRNRTYREHFGTVYARALASLHVVAELCIPLLRIGGTLVAMKSSDVKDELHAATNIIRETGGSKPEIKTIQIPGTDIVRSLIIIHKVAVTPVKYPRPYSIIIKNK